MSAKNIVIAGDYFNYRIGWTTGLVYIEDSKGYNIEDISKSNVEHYEIVTEESIKSASSAISRGLLGGFLLGPVGLLAGLSAKSKGIHTLAVQFKNGKKCLIEIDDKRYKEIIKRMF
ncbi:hypothetical protein Desaci_2027 [Desulfosporosinus acidiphilus SJ4]|uniref:Uncharacterized protein n=1 Tax=Desulfosporosinus acidiphilus (strain DSM 22704 / JCM 16185 / SJ4) TaxID=646529 RepID=I4D5C8_DESAJ|nr:hypothetical protein [Desulfosporosinus acidiphilus]AFM41002.1 hypothetical protein Desaci_2027 [Desulfosporosinus acidiphilus SJ4]